MYFFLFAFIAVRISFEKGGGDSGSSAPLPRSRIHEYSASRGAGPSEPDYPCFFKSRSAGSEIRPAPMPINPSTDGLTGLRFACFFAAKVFFRNVRFIPVIID